MAAPAILDPSQVNCTFNGRQLSGFADGTFIVVARDEDAFTKKVGADGEVARMRNKNKGGSVKLTLMQTSASNDYLAAQASLDEVGGGGTGTLLIKDNSPSGRALYSGEACWVKKHADGSFGKDTQTRDWILDIAALNMFTGGNT